MKIDRSIEVILNKSEYEVYTALIDNNIVKAVDTVKVICDPLPDANLPVFYFSSRISALLAVPVECLKSGIDEPIMVGGSPLDQNWGWSHLEDHDLERFPIGNHLDGIAHLYRFRFTRPFADVYAHCSEVFTDRKVILI